MPLFELAQGDPEHLVPFRRLRGGAELYESEIERLIWDNVEELTGEALFRVSRQAVIAGGRPDIVALDRDARVVVIEVKRDVDRGQLAQCLEYAGWARTTNLDELARMYHAGVDSFFHDWQEYTESPAPRPISRQARLLLIARDFHGRTESALEFLIEHGLPVKVISISLYEDLAGRRFLDVEAEHEPELPAAPVGRVSEPVATIHMDGRRVQLTDLLEAQLLAPGQPLHWRRPRLGVNYDAAITDAGMIRLADGREFSSPSRAAAEAAEIPAYDGWYAWRTDAGASLHELRLQLINTSDDDEGTTPETL